jgi:hypothetical protein
MLLASSCRSVYNADHISHGDRNREGTIVFVRPDRYSIFGTRSIRDYVEITYEESGENEAGLLQVEVGFRNRGGQHWWNLHGPDILLSIKAAFYERGGSGTPVGNPVYETNWQPIKITRGETSHYKAICIADNTQSYQITVSEFQK